MKKKIRAAVLCLGGIVLPAWTEELKNPIIVTATRQQQIADETLADVIVINRENIEESGVSTLPELLSRQEGVYATSNGGMGKTSTLYLRGSKQVLVLVDGMRIGSVTAGMTALEQIPLALIDRVEIVHGSASSLYGSEALGGVVQIFTRAPQKPWNADASLSYGTYNTRISDGGFSWRRGSWYAALRASEETTSGFKSIPDANRQPFIADPSRQRDGYANSGFSGRMGYQWEAGHDLGVQWLGTHGRNEYESGADANAYAKVAQQAGSAQGRYVWQKGWVSTVRLGQSEDYSKDFNPFSPQGAVYRTLQNQVALQQDISGAWGQGLLAYENLRQKGVVDDGYNRKRSINSWLGGWTHQIDAHRLQFNVRQDGNSQYGSFTSAHARYGYGLTKNLRLRAGMGNAYRAPNFNELYYPNFGKDTLKVEKAIETELGLDWSWARGQSFLTFYNRRLRDLIATICDENFNCAPENVGKATVQGIGAGSTIQLGATFLRFSVDVISPKNDQNGKLLPHSPKQKVTAHMSRKWRNWDFGATLTGVGATYDDDEEKRRLAGYALLDAFVHYTPVQYVQLQLQSSNLTNQKYQTAWGYASPGATLLLGVKLMVP